MGCGTSFVKIVLFIFNLLVALLGLAIVGIGIAVLVKWSVITDTLKGNLTVAPWVFIVIGAVIFIIAFFGCCGAIRESHCMVVTYAIFLLVIIIIQVTVAILLFVYQENLKQVLVSGVDTLFKHRESDSATNAVFNNLQQQLECCGNNGAGDYGSLTLDASCCAKTGVVERTFGTCSVVSASPGCKERVSELYDKWNKALAGAAIGVACVEVVGALFALCLANSIRNMDRRSHY